MWIAASLGDPRTDAWPDATRPQPVTDLVAPRVPVGTVMLGLVE